MPLPDGAFGRRPAFVLPDRSSRLRGLARRVQQGWPRRPLQGLQPRSTSTCIRAKQRSLDMSQRVRPLRLLAVVLATVAIAAMTAGCLGYDPRNEPDFPDPDTSQKVRAQSVILSGGTDIVLPAGQVVDLFVAYNGHARILGSARSIVVINGTAELGGGHTNGILAISSRVSLDAGSVVNGDVRTYASEVSGATASTVLGRIRDVSPDMVVGLPALGTFLFWVYVAFAISALFAGLLL